MHSHELLTELTTALQRGDVSHAQVKQVLATVQHEESHPLSRSGSYLLYGVGGLVCATGVLFLAAQIWETIGMGGRVGMTLGFGVLLTLLAVAVLRTERTIVLRDIFFGIGALLIPGGMFVLLDELSYPMDSLWWVTAVFFVCAGMYAGLTFAYQRALLAFFALAYSTATLYAFVGALTAETDATAVYEVLSMVVGVSYLALCTAVRGTYAHGLARVLHGGGVVGVLGGLFGLMLDYSLLEVVYPFAVLALYYLGVQQKSTGVLGVSSAFFVGYISYITSNYFVDSVGWPVALIVLGGIFLALGYATFTMRRGFAQGTE